MEPAVEHTETQDSSAPQENGFQNEVSAPEENGFQNEVFEVTPKSLAELKSLSHPPQAVKDVLSAALWLLGDGQKADQWQYVKSQLNKRGNDVVLSMRMKEADASTLSAKNARKAHELAAEYSPEVIRCKSSAMAGITAWVHNMISQVCPDIAYDKVPPMPTFPVAKSPNTPRPQSAPRPASPRKPAPSPQEHRPRPQSGRVANGVHNGSHSSRVSSGVHHGGAQANHEALLAESKKQTELLQQILHVQQERLKLEQARLGAEQDDSAGFSR